MSFYKFCGLWLVIVNCKGIMCVKGVFFVCVCSLFWVGLLKFYKVWRELVLDVDVRYVRGEFINDVIDGGGVYLGLRSIGKVLLV